MIFHGLNIAAFKLPVEVPLEGLLTECHRLEDTFLPHNLQLSGHHWEAGAIKGALGNWTFSDPAFYKWRKGFKPEHGHDHDRDERIAYEKLWAYTELACFAPVTTRFVKSIEDLGAFLNGARFLKIHPGRALDYHCDNNPHKEFRVTVGLEGMEDEEFVIQTAPSKYQTIPMKAGEAWFVDISLGHAVSNRGNNPRYRLGMQYYSPTSDRMLRLFEQTDAADIIYANHVVANAKLEHGE